MSDMKLVRGIGFSFGMTAGVVTILLESFPILYENATDREASVESLLMRQQRRGGGGWGGVGMCGSIVTLIIGGWNWWQLSSIFRSLTSLLLMVGIEWGRSWGRVGTFEIHSFMVCWRGLPLPLGTWGVKTSQRVSFFDLKAALGKMLISYNLRRRGFSTVDWCCMCPCNRQSVNYHLIHCQRAHQ